MKIRKSITAIAMLTAFFAMSVASLAKDLRPTAASQDARGLYEAQFNTTELEHQF
ncbi:MAG: hypothetical protein HY900_02250 [Deltaproteobacteria bacterium]|nr:hypothetical protein [Deltaproteobacteria bacterium]